ncbi:hypothetical protein BDV93DRAFT_520791 [Ceratobasidium sp. AG-I]|nr:hypothetical protein BDV93DRAFT_520791 [Ceratobasidium sp. AG-I]
MSETSPEPALDTQKDSTTPSPATPNTTSKSSEVAPPASQTPPQQSSSQSSVPQVSAGPKPKNAAQQSAADVWRLKELYWPPDDETRPVVRIITQNENGPCGLIALCNILILRGDIVVQPPNRKSVGYEYLAELVADHILSSPSLDPTSDDLANALSTLPHTQRGMDLNPVFTSLSNFSHSPNSPTHAPTLFNLSRVRLVHGWLADPQARAYSVLEKVKDYDAATTLIVGCDAVMGGQLVESVGGGGNENGGEGEGGNERSAEERQMIQDAFLVRDFLDSNPTQLTYHGLESLFSDMHARELVCLFRNSHLGVLYKRVDEQGQESLWTLVTDANFANEGEIAWESLCDVDGAGSVFVDSRFRPASTAGGDYAGQAADQALREQAQVEALAAESSDFEIARRLQAEEEEHERRRIEAEERRQRQERKPVYGPEYQYQQQQQRRESQQVPTRQMENMRISSQQVTADQLAGGSKKTTKKDKDKDCVVM